MSEQWRPSPRPSSQQPLAQWPTGRLLSAVARRVERDWNAHLEGWDLNHASLPVLYLLAAGPLSQRELAQSSGVTEQTMSRILVRLERSGYISRRAHARDRRRHEVVLTEAGRTALLEAGDRSVAEAITVRGLSPAQVVQLRSLLTAMLPERAAAAEHAGEHAGPAEHEQEPTSTSTSPPAHPGRSKGSF